MQATEALCRAADPMNHRWGQRITLEVPVRLEVDGRPMGRGLIRNASISGAFIETALELPAFSCLLVRLPAASDDTPTPEGLAACMVRRVPGGIAVEWRDMECPQIVGLLKRISGRTAAALRGDEAFD
jgi:hypothetical protein